MNSFAQEEFTKRYSQGKSAFECGQYRQSVKYLEDACKLVSLNSRLGGEVQMWLVNAYQAVGDGKSAIALCQNLCTHPHVDTKIQAQRLLYILQAPELQRPKEWMTEIPDLNAKSSLPINRRASSPRKIEPKRQIELVDLSTVNTKDNQFLWVSLIISLGAIASLWIL
ncbi:MAG: tetratricopeptide repeat protein [Cyanobacterium sp.]